MSASTANGITILEGVFYMPRSGAWHADILVDTRTLSDVASTLTISLTGGTMTLIGTPIRPPIIWNGHAKCRIVAGQNALGTVLMGQGYNGISAKAVLGDIAVSSGESVSATANASLLSTVFPQYVRLGGDSAGTAIQTLADALSATWRMLPDGTIWLGTETWPALPIKGFDVLSQDSSDGTMTVGVETVTALPGMTFMGNRIGRCTHRVQSKTIRTEFIFDDG